MASNRFDLIRLVLASVVFLYHAVVLSAFARGTPLEPALGKAAEFAIQGFFIVSGALVAGSLARSDSLVDFAGKRVRRLYPAYAVVILIPALISLLVSGDISGVGKYLAANLVFLNFLSPNLPGLFEDNRFTEVNGALWTLKIEVMFYLVLPAIAWLLKRLGRYHWAGLGLLYATGEMWRFYLPVVSVPGLPPEIAHQLPSQMAFFASGIAFWQVWSAARSRPGLFGLVGIGLLILSELHPALEPFRAAGLAGVIAFIAFAPGPSLNAARFGDISYGVYITHFPILQGLVMAGAFAALGVGAALTLSVALVVAASFLLWHLVERPALRPSSHYRKVADIQSEG